MILIHLKFQYIFFLHDVKILFMQFTCKISSQTLIVMPWKYFNSKENPICMSKWNSFFTKNTVSLQIYDRLTKGVFHFFYIITRTKILNFTAIVVTPNLILIWVNWNESSYVLTLLCHKNKGPFQMSSGHWDNTYINTVNTKYLKIISYKRDQYT